MKNTMFNKETVLNKINKRNGLLVTQLYDWLPEDERPNRKYFTEFLRKIKGVKLLKYDSGENVLFATTSHKVSMNQKRLAIMIEEADRILEGKSSFIIEEKDLLSLYRFLIKHKNSFYKNLEEGCFWMNYYLAFQKDTLRKNDKKPEAKPDEEEEGDPYDEPEEKKKPEKPIGPFKPPITLLQLYKRNIYLRPHYNSEGIYEITFHLFDVGDNLSQDKLKRDIEIMSAFLAYHRINVRYSVVVYTWSETKKNQYAKQIVILKEKLKRLDFADWASKDDLITVGFNGVSYVNLDAARFFNTKPGEVLNEKKLIKTVEYKKKSVIKKTLRFDFRKSKKANLSEETNVDLDLIGNEVWDLSKPY